ncbi:MAG: hypothetical protein CM1200mP35_04110 [Chloroflexota bacterium]|nr:MAG: hypothetical protein CM1200mP35_04110 [Chloroflexota bacterium]
MAIKVGRVPYLGLEPFLFRYGTTRHRTDFSRSQRNHKSRKVRLIGCWTLSCKPLALGWKMNSII